MQKDDTNLSQKKKQLSNYAKYSSIAIQMMVIISLGAIGGLKLDEFLTLRFPVFTLVFSLLAVALSIYLTIKDIINLNK